MKPTIPHQKGALDAIRRQQNVNNVHWAVVVATMAQYRRVIVVLYRGSGWRVQEGEVQRNEAHRVRYFDISMKGYPSAWPSLLLRRSFSPREGFSVPCLDSPVGCFNRLTKLLRRFANSSMGNTIRCSIYCKAVNALFRSPREGATILTAAWMGRTDLN